MGNPASGKVTCPAREDTPSERDRTSAAITDNGSRAPTQERYGSITRAAEHLGYKQRVLCFHEGLIE